MTSRQMLWVGFGLLTTLLAASIVAILHSVRVAQTDVDLLANDVRQRSATAHELEINLLGHALNARAYVQSLDPSFNAEAAPKAAILELHLAEYGGLAETVQQREATQSSVNDPGAATIAQLDQMARLRIELERFLDERLQADAVAVFDKQEVEAQGNIKLIAVSGLMLLAIGVLTAVALGRTVGRSILEKEREVENGPAVRTGRERLRATLASIGDGVITTDPQGRITMLNAMAQALTGWSQNEGAGQPITRVFHIVNEETRAEVANPVHRALGEGKIVGLANHSLLIAKDGTERVIDDSAAPIKEGSTVVGAVLVFRDISERKDAEAALREREHFLARIANVMPGMVHVFDLAEQRPVFINPAVTSVLGYSDAEVLAMGAEAATRLVHPEDLPRFEQHMRKIHQLGDGETADFEYRIRDTTGAWHWFLSRDVVFTRDTAGGVRQIIGTATDITERKRADEVLRESLDQQRLFIENAPTAIAHFDRDMRYLSANRRWLNDYGLSDDIIGRSHYAVFPEVPDAWKDVHRRALAGEVVRADADPFDRPGGVTQWLNWEVRPWHDAKGEIGGIVIGAEDITQRKLAEEALRASLLRKVDTLKPALDEHAIVAMTDPQGRITFVSDKFCAISKYTRDELLGQDHRIINSGHHPKAFYANLWGTIARGEVWHGEIRNRAKDNSVYWVDTIIVPVLDESGKPRQYVAIRADITEHVQAEEELREADRHKDEFLATLAHELRNPLAPVRNAVQILRLKIPAMPDLQWACDVIDRQTQAMSRLIDDLMDVSRISRGKVELTREPLELAKVLHAAVETSRPLIEQMEHKLTVTLPPGPLIVDADMTRLAQVFNNLLNNAAKYTERGGRIELTATPQGSDVVVLVRDNGIGIAADKLPSLFRMFSQVEAALSRSQGGLGIGLYLVKRLVEMHGGKIDVRSDGPGLGSEFRVRLPLVVARALRTTANDVAIPTTDLRVLLADDNRDAADSLATLLRMMGNDVHVVYDGAAAVQAAAELDPHVVLLDIGMPTLNGYEAARAIRQQPRSRKVILVAMTGWGQPKDRLTSQEAGFDRHLVKPVDPQALMKMLAELNVVTA
jgi:PAS domain S-box-containing protein